MPPLPESSPPSTREPLIIQETLHLSKYNLEGSLIETLHYRNGDDFMLREMPDGRTQTIRLIIPPTQEIDS